MTTIAAEGNGNTDLGNPMVDTTSIEDSNGDGVPNIDANGNVTTSLVAKDHGAYYQWIQGTSMASPHAVGVAALAVAHFGTRDQVHGGLTLAPAETERHLLDGARDTPCPTPPVLDYPDLPDPFTATCVGDADRNGFYGDGIVNAVGVLRP